MLSLYIFTHMHTHIYMYAHAYTYTYMYTRAYTYAHTYMHTRMAAEEVLLLLHISTHAHTNTHTHTNANTRQHMCAHIHGQQWYCHIKHTHTHTHTLMKSGDFVRGDRTRSSAAFGPSTNHLATDAIKRLIIIWHLSRLQAELVHLRDCKCQKHYDLLITNWIIYLWRTPCDITNSEGMLSRLQAELVRLRDFEVVRRERDEQFQIRFENEVCVRTLKPIYSAIHCI